MKEFEDVVKIIRSYISTDEANLYAFGSRVENTHRSDSDLDILIDDLKVIKPEKLTLIEEALEESDIPFKVDLVVKSRITKEFFQKISSSLYFLE